MVYGDGETPIAADGEGKVLISRSADEVFSEKTIASFEGKAVTITHPNEFVNPSNWSSLTKGILKNVRRGTKDQSEDLIADLLITDSTAIALVKNGLREVSCGYEAEYTQTGEGKGIQTNIIGNHLALVREGRAGSSYAINDHKKGATKMKMTEKIKAIFAKAQDEALKVASDEAVPEEKKEESKDAGAYDELVKLVKDLGAKVEAMAKPKDEAKKEEKEMPKDEKEVPEEKAKDESSLEERLKVLEAAVQKLLEHEATEMGDEEKEYGEEKAKDEKEEEEGYLTGDAATDSDILSRAEILAPGIEVSKDIKAKALKAAYATKDGKKVIDAINGGKEPAYDSAEKVETLFIAASELLKATRSSDFAKSKTRDNVSLDSTVVGPITAEKMNEINSQFYKTK